MNTITQTADGSNTLYNETIGEHYHSKHGAVQESKHVFIDAGLKFASSGYDKISVLEVGFGTGLNFIFSMDFCQANQINLDYTSIEAYPLERETIENTGYSEYVPQQIWQDYISAYETALTHKTKISELCHLEIPHMTLAEFNRDQKFDIIYYDAFSVQHQPEMWSDETIAHVSTFLKPGGTFVTYAITGKLKRALKANGCTIEKLPGAPGKREMLRATKL